MQQGTSQVRLQSPYLGGPQSLGARLDRELYLLVLTQRMESKPLNVRMMNEYVLSGLAGNETKPLGIVEPFNGSSLSFSHFSYSL